MMSGTLQTHHLKQISEEDCWLLFEKHAFENASVSAYSDLEVIGRKIVNKCNGLPLAAKSLGGLLRSKLNVKEWESILNSEIWEFSHEKSKILPALWLSYNYLPPHLKRCFAYCSIFPKNYAFTKLELILLWKAEGFLEPKKKVMVEEVGYGYFDDLTSRSFWQHIKHFESQYIMHDLLNDLAKFVSGEFCVRWGKGDSPNVLSKTRHFSYEHNYGDDDDFKNFEALREAKYLRTFNPSLGWAHELRMLGVKVLHDLLSKLRYLRVLNLAKYDVKELPNSIGNLNHLRHLDLSGSSIEKLPDTVCTLYNLQTILLSYCRALTQLPTNFGRLFNLHYLGMESIELEKMPPHMGNLKDLQILNEFVVDKHTARHDILELKKLQNLHKRLIVSGLCNLVHAKDELGDNIMRDKKYLRELVLYWGYSITDDSHIKERARDVFEKLQPHANLERLTIAYYGGTSFPSWLGHHSQEPKPPKLLSLSELEISYCPNIVCFPDGGLDAPNLMKLAIHVCKKLGSLPEQMHTLLPSLESLYIRYFPELESFSEGGLPLKLKSLYIRSCNKLMANRMQWGLQRLTSLTLLSLGFKDCEDVVDDSFPEEGLLPTTLTQLSIFYHLNLKKMDGKGFGRLNSLEKLSILRCPELQCLPDEGLPTSLSWLYISECPLLSQRCEREKGEEWPKIAHIPIIRIVGMHI